MNLTSIIDRLGGEATVARHLGCGVSAVSNWKARGLPKGRIVDLLQLARARDVPMTMADLQDVPNQDSISCEYDQDFHAWTQRQAALLRSGALDKADIRNIAEEIESMGRAERSEMVSRLEVLLQHLLKWQYQPALRSTSWRLSIKEQRYRIADLLDESPSLRQGNDRLVAKAYRRARIAAQRETGLAEQDFPESCPFAWAQIEHQDYLPD